MNSGTIIGAPEMVQWEVLDCLCIIAFLPKMVSLNLNMGKQSDFSGLSTRHLTGH